MELTQYDYNAIVAFFMLMAYFVVAGGLILLVFYALPRRKQKAILKYIDALDE
jgi:Na+/melibiose symporter-like transporter